MGLCGLVQDGQSQKFEQQNDWHILFLEEQAEEHLQHKLEFLDSQTDAILDQQVQQQRILENENWDTDDNSDQDTTLTEFDWDEEEENPTQFRQLQLQTELQLQQVQLDELDATLEAVLAANEDFASHSAGRSLYRVGHKVQSQLSLLAEQVKALLPYVEEMDQYTAHYASQLDVKCGQSVQHLRDQLGAIIYEVSESLYILEEQGDSDWELRQLEKQFSEQEHRLRALHHHVGRLVVELGQARKKVPNTPVDKTSVTYAAEQIFGEKIQQSDDFRMLCLPGSVGMQQIAFAAIAA